MPFPGQFANANQMIRGSATGGTITDISGYKVHKFTNNETFQTVKGLGPVECLVVAGGGTGGSFTNPVGSSGSKSIYIRGGGGGAGGLISKSAHILTNSIIFVNVGAGGFNSTFDTIVATRGGSGGNAQKNTTTLGYSGTGAGGSGGSGGGGIHLNVFGGRIIGGVGGVGNTPLIFPSQGNNGAGGGASGGGGGGAGGAASGSTGGSGISSSITGSSVIYSVGGNGASTVAPVAGQQNTGNGGGGALGLSNAGSTNNLMGASGGSGVVVIRYAV